MNQTTVSKATTELIRAGLIVEQGTVGKCKQFGLLLPSSATLERCPNEHSPGEGCPNEHSNSAHLGTEQCPFGHTEHGKEPGKEPKRTPVGVHGDDRGIKFKSATKSRRKPETPFPDHLVLTDELRAFAKPGIDVEADFARFRDHALSKDRRCRDWVAAWRNWCRSNFAKPTPPSRSTNGRGFRRNFLEERGP